jgi:hypothetical protein
MYFAYSWPKLFNADPKGGDGEEFFFLHASQQYVLAVSRTSVVLWSGGLNRVWLSSARLDNEEITQEGHYIAALYSPVKATLIILVRVSKICAILSSL